MNLGVKPELGPRRRDAGCSFEARPAPVAGSYDPVTGAGSAPGVAGDPAPIDDVLDVAGATQLLRIGRNTVYELVARNAIPHRRLGKQIRFSRAAIMRWLGGWSLQGAKEGQ
jgi:excisionase family DNA binding protein